MRLFITMAFVAVAITACNKDNENNNNGDNQLELVFQDSTYQLTGVAKEEGGQLLVNYPRWSDIYKYGVVQTQGTTGKIPYPNEAMNQWAPGQAAGSRWVCVQSVYFDDKDSLWILDPAAPMMKTIQGNGAKLVKMNKATNTVERSYPLNGIVPDSAYVNDVRIDLQTQFAYLSESKIGGIIVVNLASGQRRTVLETHSSTKSDPAYKFIIDGMELMKEGKPVKINSDGIALSPDKVWLYYKPLTDDKLYRIRTEFLRDWTMGESDLGAKVEDLGHFATTDGMIFDESGNLYFGDLQNYRILRISPELKTTTLVEDQRLIWPDSYSIADGYLYISCSQIQKQPEYNNGVNKRTTPYTVYRMKLP